MVYFKRRYTRAAADVNDYVFVPRRTNYVFVVLDLGPLKRGLVWGATRAR